MTETNIVGFLGMVVEACPDISICEIQPGFNSGTTGSYALVVFTFSKPFLYEQVAESVKALTNHFRLATYDGDQHFRFCCNHGDYGVWDNGGITSPVKFKGENTAYKQLGILAQPAQTPTKRKGFLMRGEK